MLNISQDFNIYNIDILKRDVITEIEKLIELEEKKLVLNFEKVDDIDAAGLQLIISTYNTAKEESLDFKITNANEIVKKVFAIAGSKEIQEVLQDE